MGIKPECRKCHKELVDFGAILFSPPIDDMGTASICTTVKSHICKSCYDLLERGFFD